MARDPNDLSAKRQVIADKGPLGVILAMQGDTDGGLKMLDDQMKDAQGYSAVCRSRSLAWRGQIYEIRRDYRKAADYFEQAIAMWNSDPGVLKIPNYAAEVRETERRLARCRRTIPKN